MQDTNEQYHSLFAIFDSIYPLSSVLKETIIKKSKVINVKKKTLLLKAGNHSKTIYFIIQGGARVYYLNKEGKEINTWFLFENELLISVFGFFTARPSFENIEVLEDSVLIAVERNKLDEIYNEFLEFNFIGRKLTENYYIRNELQANNLRTLNATARYEEFITNNPNLINRLSLGNIASYLGISPETLSRIRKEIRF
jgi:CRP-like cAMP-binding protein